MKKPKVVDIFSGCGGMSWGLFKAGFEVIAGIDKWDKALVTFRHNHPNTKTINGNIEELTAEDILSTIKLKKGELECLVGGPPCQGFSKNVPASYRFISDSRNQLYKHFIEMVRGIEPKTLVIENVAEIYNAYDGLVREEIISQLEELGYLVNVKIIYAPDYGVPQRRRRCLFFASRTGIKPRFPPPTHGETRVKGLFREISKYVSAWDAISDLPSLQNGEGSEPVKYPREPLNPYQSLMRENSSLIYDHIAKNLRPKQFNRLNSISPGEGFKELPDELRPKSGYSGAYGRLDFTMLAPTITTWVYHPGSGRYGHPKDIRIITIREAARLQSFSDDFRFYGSYNQKAGQVGNAVPPLIMYNLADFILDCLQD